MEKENSANGGGYVGGFFHLFDWTGKSRKKLFSSKADLPEGSKAGKKSRGNFPTTGVYMMDEDEAAAGSSIRGSSDYSCASSVTDEEGCGTKAPSVVARLMGLDSMPTSAGAEPYSAPYFDRQSFCDSHYNRKKLDYRHDQKIAHSEDLPYKMEVPVGRFTVDSKPQKISSRPIERYQTEVLPPKSAKSIPITHHKLLSPIKSPGFLPSSNATDIMEAAAKVISPGPQASANTKMPRISSSSIPLRVRDLKEKAEAARKMSLVGSSKVPLTVQDTKEKVQFEDKSSRYAEISQRPAQLNPSKHLKGLSMNKSLNGLVETSSVRAPPHDEVNSTDSSNRGKSVSLAIQAKVNVQRREGLNSSGSRGPVGQKEQFDAMPSKLLMSQSNVQKNSHKKSVQNASGILRQNNQKQNCPSDQNKIPSKRSASDSQGRKMPSGDLFSRRHKTSSKVARKSKTEFRKLASEARDSEKNISSSGVKTLPRKKQFLEKDHLERNQEDDWLSKRSQKSINSDQLTAETINWVEDSRKKGMDVVSFTFTTPMARSLPKPDSSSATAHRNNGLSTDHRDKRLLSDSEGMNLSSLRYHAIDAGALSKLLEQKLQDLTSGAELSHQSAEVGPTSSSSSASQDLGFSFNAETMKLEVTDKKDSNMMHKDEGVHSVSECLSNVKPVLRLKNTILGVHEMYEYSSNKNNVRYSFDYQNPSPVSTLEPSLWTESCNSSDSIDSSTIEGVKQCSSLEAQGSTGLSSAKRLHHAEMELSDSASTMSLAVEVRASTTTYSMGSSNWELEYVKEILCSAELMFRDFALGRSREIVNPHLFDKLESLKGKIGTPGGESRLTRKFLFDGVSECLDLKCRRYVGGGCRTWAKGVAKVRRRDLLAEEVYREISGWRGMGNCIVDELVDKDMSSQYGRWLEFEVDAFSLGVEIEAQIFSSLVDQLVADMLQY